LLLNKLDDFPRQAVPQAQKPLEPGLAIPQPKIRFGPLNAHSYVALFDRGAVEPNKRAVHITEGCQHRQPEQKFAVLAVRQFEIEPTCLSDQVGASHKGGQADHHAGAAGPYQEFQGLLADTHLSLVPVALFRKLEEGACFWVVDQFSVRVTSATLSVKLFEGLELPFQLVAFPFIVRVEKGNPLALCFGDSLVPSRASALIDLIIVADPIAKCLRNDIPCVVLRPVVHNNDLEVRKRLGQYTFNALQNLGRSVVGWDNDRYSRIHDPITCHRTCADSLRTSARKSTRVYSSHITIS